MQRGLSQKQIIGKICATNACKDSRLNIIPEYFSHEGRNDQLIRVDHLDEILVPTIDAKSIVKGKDSKPFLSVCTTLKNKKNPSTNAILCDSIRLVNQQHMACLYTEYHSYFRRLSGHENGEVAT